MSFKQTFEEIERELTKNLIEEVIKTSLKGLVNSFNDGYKAGQVKALTDLMGRIVAHQYLSASNVMGDISNTLEELDNIK
tara:strand:+ start:1034 stop:1273 length:240 start_codon:yes stop_codon:yes gene_type:complete